MINPRFLWYDVTYFTVNTANKHGKHWYFLNVWKRLSKNFNSNTNQISPFQIQIKLKRKWSVYVISISINQFRVYLYSAMSKEFKKNPDIGLHLTYFMFFLSGQSEHSLGIYLVSPHYTAEGLSYKEEALFIILTKSVYVINTTFGSVVSGQMKQTFNCLKIMISATHGGKNNRLRLF